MTKNPGTAPSEFLRQDLYVAEELVAAASNILGCFLRSFAQKQLSPPPVNLSNNFVIE